MEQESITNQVLTHHLIAFGNNDLDEIMKDYTEESEVFSLSGPLKGLVSIREFFKAFFTIIPSGSTFEMKQLSIKNNLAYIVWTSESPVAKIPVGTDTFLIEGDKIKYHTVADYRITNN